jgi:hypothetical protein
MPSGSTGSAPGAPGGMLLTVVDDMVVDLGRFSCICRLAAWQQPTEPDVQQLPAASRRVRTLSSSSVEPWLPGCRVLPGRVAGLPGCCRLFAGLPGAAGCRVCRVSAAGSAAGCCRVLPGAAGCCRVLPGAARLRRCGGTSRCCRVLPGAAGCRVAGRLPGRAVGAPAGAVFQVSGG